MLGSPANRTMGRQHGRTASKRISAGRSALWIAGRGAEGLLPHQGGAVGDLLLGQADGADTAGAPCWRSRRLTSKISASASSATAISCPTTAATRSARRSSCSSTTARRRTHSSPSEPMNKAGVYQQGRNPPLVEQLRQARGRLSPQGHAAVPVHGAEDRHQRVLPPAPARARIRTSRRMATASSSADRSARRTARTISARRCCSNCRTARRRTSSGTRSRFRRTAGIKGTRGS